MLPMQARCVVETGTYPSEMPPLTHSSAVTKKHHVASLTWHCGPMDKASVYETEDRRFEPCLCQNAKCPLFWRGFASGPETMSRVAIEAHQTMSTVFVPSKAASM